MNTLYLNLVGKISMKADVINFGVIIHQVIMKKNDFERLNDLKAKVKKYSNKTSGGKKVKQAPTLQKEGSYMFRLWQGSKL